MKKRLNKLMSERNICSRREADKLIDKRWVKVNGEIVTQKGILVSEDAKIELVKEAQKEIDTKVTILLNKPLGIVSTQPEKGYTPAIDLITKENQIKKNEKRRFEKKDLIKLSCVGRLDIDSKGLLVFTQDGVLAKKIISKDSNVEKEYLVRFTGNLTDEKLKKLRFGLSLDGKKLKKAKVKLLEDHLLKVILIEGKKRQIRRMLEMVDLKVSSLKRVRIGKVCLSDLPACKWRYLKKNESFF